MSSVDTDPTTTSVGESSSSRVRAFKCNQPECGKAYSKPSLLEQHRRSHTNERPFKCDKLNCGKSFLRKSHLQAHLVSHEAQSSKPFHCSICGKGVNTQQHLKRHEITHTRSFQCEYKDCNESFYKHQSLRHHVMSVHEKKLTCKSCNKTFSRPYRLAQHTIKYHSDSPTYQCDHHGCFHNFKTWSALQLHLKTEHPKVKCKVCGKGCVGKNGLKSHMLSHDNDKMVKLWNCKYCDVGRFSKKNDLIEHYNTFHDKNVPDDLLKPDEREYLENLLSQSINHNKKIDLNTFNPADIDEADVEAKNEVLGDSHKSLKSLDSLQSTLKSGNHTIVELILGNFNKRKIECPKKNCNRRFSREYDLKRHLDWHTTHLKRVEDYLNSLKTNAVGSPKECVTYPPVENNEFNDNDDLELDSLIDLELKLLRAGET